MELGVEEHFVGLAEEVWPAGVVRVVLQTECHFSEFEVKLLFEHLRSVVRKRRVRPLLVVSRSVAERIKHLYCPVHAAKVGP